MDTFEKMKVLRSHREKEYTKLQNAVYKERGWNQNGCPTMELLKELGIAYKDVIKYIKPYQ